MSDQTELFCIRRTYTPHDGYIIIQRSFKEFTSVTLTRYDIMLELLLQSIFQFFFLYNNNVILNKNFNSSYVDYNKCYRIVG